ncbi:MAG: hypothetical protein KBC26_00305 [Candidatus Pacebacteria bacterium]|nr:hypothetical protein [Candidatus Paceibacterota bacterium]
MPRTPKKKVVTVVDIVAPDRKEANVVRTRRIEEDIPEPHIVKEFSDASERESIFTVGDTSGRKHKEDDASFQVASVRSRRHRRWWPFIVAGLVVLAVFFYVALVVLPRVSVRVVTKKIPVSFDGTITVSTRVSDNDLESGVIPGEKITEKGSTVRSIVASGEKNIEQKAGGVVTIVNAYSTAAQPLVATTRFETPDGKIYRLVKGITIPGAKMVAGTLEPSTIDASVVADKAGTEYNIGPVSKFTIPGFKGSDKFQKFYATSDAPMTGGFIGKGAVASPADIERAKKDAQEELKGALMVKLVADQQDLKLVPGAEQFTVTNVVVNPKVETDGTFKITIEGELAAIKFRETDIGALIRARAIKDQKIDSALTEKESSLSYQTPSVSSSSTIKIPLIYSAKLWHALDAGTIASNSVGKKELDLKKELLALPGVDKMTVSFWPFWVGSAPSRVDRITVTIE